MVVAILLKNYQNETDGQDTTNEDEIVDPFIKCNETLQANVLQHIKDAKEDEVSYLEEYDPF